MKTTAAFPKTLVCILVVGMAACSSAHSNLTGAGGDGDAGTAGLGDDAAADPSGQDPSNSVTNADAGAMPSDAGRISNGAVGSVGNVTLADGGICQMSAISASCPAMTAPFVDCATCDACIAQNCCTQMTTASGDCVTGQGDCAQLVQCANACNGRRGCIRQCENQHPAGLQTYQQQIRAVRACAQRSCDTQCAQTQN